MKEKDLLAKLRRLSQSNELRYEDIGSGLKSLSLEGDRFENAKIKVLNDAFWGGEEFDVLKQIINLFTHTLIYKN